MISYKIIEMIEAEWRDRLEAAVRAEREACAKLCESNVRTGDNDYTRGANMACRRDADMIRAKNNPK
jgi:hypothetical protein